MNKEFICGPGVENPNTDLRLMSTNCINWHHLDCRVDKCECDCHRGFGVAAE